MLAYRYSMYLPVEGSIRGHGVPSAQAVPPRRRSVEHPR